MAKVVHCSKCGRAGHNRTRHDGQRIIPPKRAKELRKNATNAFVGGISGALAGRLVQAIIKV